MIPDFFLNALSATPDGLADEGDLSAPLTAAPTPAAVLVLLIEQAGGIDVLFTRRTDHLSDHPGQVCFPGGRMETGETPWQTAVREAGEEVGMPPEWPKPLGYLPPYRTGTGFRIFPTVARVDAPPFALEKLTGEDAEVADIFTVPLTHLLDFNNHRREKLVYRGREHRYWVIGHDRWFIWGATAGMIVSLARRCRGLAFEGG
ncbi:MAG: CoA pyrophosphatase [Zoogloeaceae bacterium]|jgi:8-oxo-dGTP pyrophosphatase MutT (NUDIX family)|nr:CoA pyrophosphatase [Zoogloeaceae bacterium]